MTNGQKIAAYCELHSKEVIFAAAIISISRALKNDPAIMLAKIIGGNAGDIALTLMKVTLDTNGIELHNIAKTIKV